MTNRILGRVPWMQNVPRFAVIDNSIPIPNQPRAPINELPTSLIEADQRRNSSLNSNGRLATVVSGAFARIDKFQRGIPNLNPIGALINASPTTVVSGALAKIDEDQRRISSLNSNGVSVNASPATGVRGGTDEILETQIKLNTELMKRLDALESERKTFMDEINALRVASDQNKKENMFYKTKYTESSAEISQLKDKLSKRNPDTKAVPLANKENINNTAEN